MHRDAYIRIFERLGLRYVIVAAMSGAMGGSASEEFLADAEVGEDTYVKCTNCDYAANVEAVQVPAAAPIAFDGLDAAHVEDTPDTPTIDTLVAHLNERFPRADRPWAAGDTLKNVIVLLRHPDGTQNPSPSACQATARSTGNGSRRRWPRPRSRRSPRCTSPPIPH